MGWFDRAVQRGVEAGVKNAFDKFTAPGGGLEDALWSAVDTALKPNERLTETGFIWALRLCFVRHGTSRAEAVRLANSTYDQYLADEKIRFGDPAYSWTRADADDIADEYELRHWEAA